MTSVIGDVQELGLDSNLVSDFYRNHWARKIALSIPSFYQWQFKQSPSDCGNDHCMVAINDSSGEIQGVMGLNRRPFFLNGSLRDGAELTTWIVAEKYIGKGIGAKILKKIQSKYEVLIGMGITDKALPIYMRSGFRYIKSIPRFCKVFDFDAISDYAQYTPLARKLAREWANTGKHTPFICNSSIDADIQASQANPLEQFNHFSRAKEFLEWRFSKHPVFKYQQQIVYSDAEPGGGAFVCMRVEAGINNLKVLHVMDCFGDPLDMQAAISFINAFCRDNGVHLADFYCTSPRINRHFIFDGWFSTNDDHCFQFPHLFHPIELRNPPTTSLIYWSRDDFLDMADISKLYITKQDADLDRPTAETYKSLHGGNGKIS